MVAAIPVFDVIADALSGGSAPLGADVQLEIVSGLVTATLDEHENIEALDTYGPRKKSRWYLTPPMAPAFRKMHEDWLEQADALLARVSPMVKAGQVVRRFDELREAVAFRHALLKITIEGIERGMERIHQGKFVTLEEARRELRAKRGQ